MRLKEFLSESAQSTIVIEHPTVKKAYAKIDLKCLWNKGTKREKEIPTLKMVEVPSRYRGKGIGKELISLVLDEMRSRSLNFLVFDNFDKYFWDSVEQNFRGNVFWLHPSGKYAKQIGALLLDSSVDTSQIFEQ
jgi:GNAT superfamily N-acetyltransferase